MTTAQKVGQLLMVPLNLSDDVSVLDSVLGDGMATGILLLGNGWSKSHVSQVTQYARMHAIGQPTAFYIAVDQEGGQVQRLSGSGFSKIPSAVTQGTWTPQKLTDQATTWAQELKAAGVNLNLAPVADTVPSAMTRQNQPIGALQREFGSTPATVGQHAVAFIKGMTAGGIQSCVKHFPGLGRVSGNTDFTDVGVEDTTTTTTDAYLSAFKKSMSAKPAMVMISLATYGKIDAKNPAVFSSKVITSLLRGKLGWQGVVISDAMEGEAIKSVPVAQRGVNFIKAGGDIAIFSSLSDLQKAAAGIEKLMNSNSAFAAKVDAAVLRVLRAKAEAGLLH